MRQKRKSTKRSLIMNTSVKSTGEENLLILSVIKHPKVMAANTVSDAGVHNEKPVKKHTHTSNYIHQWVSRAWKESVLCPMD